MMMSSVFTGVFRRDVGDSVIESAHVGASSSLALLRAIDQTVDSLAALESKAKGDRGQVMLMVSAIQNRNTDCVLDPDGILEVSILKAVKVCEKIGELLKRAHADISLNGEHRGDVCGSYDAAMIAVEDLRAAFETSVVEIKAHDLEFSTFEGPFDSVAEMLADLK